MANQEMVIRRLASVGGVKKWGVFQRPEEDKPEVRLEYGTLAECEAYVTTYGALVSTDVSFKDNKLVNPTFGELFDFDESDANTAHAAGDGSDHANVALNDTHRASDGTDHANVVVNDAHVAGDGSDHADVAANSVITAKALQHDNVYQITFVGAAAAGSITPTSKTTGVTPAIGDKMLFVSGVVTATGVPVTMPDIGTDLAALLIDDTGAKINQLSASDLSANTYVAFMKTM